LENVASYLPKINLECIATSSASYFTLSVEYEAAATVSGLFDAISNGCSNDELSLSVSGSYNQEVEELEVIFVVGISTISDTIFDALGNP